MMKRLKHHLTTLKCGRRGFYVFVGVLFVSIFMLTLIYDNEWVEAFVMILFAILGLNLGVYFYIEDRERGLRDRRKTDGFGDR